MLAARMRGAAPPIDEAGPAAAAADMRMRDLVGAADWGRLPPAIRRRFSKPYAEGEQRIYRGRVVLTELSSAGTVLAFLARAIGAPLPDRHGATGAAAVIVSQDPVSGHQNWTRCYARAGAFDHVIQSAKRFQGPTGLEEYVGCGIGMTLGVGVEGGALVFRSRGYFLEVLGRRFAVPKMLEPGEMEIVHARERADPVFSFKLTLRHARLGILIRQIALFTDESEADKAPLRSRDRAPLQGVARFG